MEETVPPPLATDQVTAVLVVPVTVAVNCTVPPVATEVLLGLTLTVIAGGVVLTVTVALPFLLESATLVATIVAVPAVAGAV